MSLSPASASDVPPYDLSALRKHIPILSSIIPMNNCSQAPQTDATRAAAERYLEGWNRIGMDWDEWIEEVRLAKCEFAKLINASPDEIAVFSCVSEAVSAVASAIDFAARPQVVASEAEFPTVGHVWLAQDKRGARATWVPVCDGQIDLASYDRAIDDTTAVVSACHGYYMNGFVQDVAAIAERAHANGALLFVDAYQTLGTIPIDVHASKLDFLACGNLKYLMGIPGIAFLYVRSGIIDRLHPSVTGWFGRTDPFAFDVKRLDWSATASRFDTGTPPVIAAYIARAGMSLVNSVGITNIRRWTQVLGNRMIEGGRARGLELHGTSDMSKKTPSTAFRIADSHAVEVAMRERGVLLSARGSVIRLAPHYYTTLDDVDTALDTLAAVLQS